MASLSTCHLGLWLGWQILLNLVKVLSLVQLLYTVVIPLFLPGEATSYLFIQVNWYLPDTCFIAMNVTVLSRIAFLKICQFAYIVLVSEQLTKKLISAFLGASFNTLPINLVEEIGHSNLLADLLGPGVSANDNYMVVVAGGDVV